MDGLELIQHVIDLLAVVHLMEAVKSCQLHDVIVVGIVGVEDECVLWDEGGKREEVW